MTKITSLNAPTVQRTHDQFYLTVDRKAQPKEYFKFVVEQVNSQISDLNGKAILDIGCATGDFLYFLQSCFPAAKLSGLDVLPDLLERAQKEIPGANFSVADISSPSFLAHEKFDAVFMLGVHSIFDDLSWLKNAVSLMNPGGHFFCFGLFNSFDIDVFIKARKKGSETLESGWNVFSKSTVLDYLGSIGLAGQFTPWTIPFAVPPNATDAYRSWTVLQTDGTHEIRNGLQLVHTFELLHVSQG